MPWIAVTEAEVYVVSGLRVNVGGCEYLSVLGLNLSLVFEESNTLTHLNPNVD